MSLAHLTGESGRDTAVVRGQEVLVAPPMPSVEAWLRAELEAAPERALVGVLAGDEDRYLEWAAEQLQRMAAAPFVMIGELYGEDWDRVRTLELRTPEGRADKIEYDLAGTPCANVVGQTACIYPEQVSDLFPADELLVEMGVESYAGLPLFDPGGRPLGLIILFDRRPWEEDRMREALGLMVAFRPRIETILVNRRARRDMELLSERLEAGGGADPIGQLALTFAHAMNVKGAFVSSYVSETRQRMRTLALAIHGRLLDGVEYELAGTPFAEVDAAGELLLRGEQSEAWQVSHQATAGPYGDRLRYRQ